MKIKRFAAALLVAMLALCATGAPAWATPVIPDPTADFYVADFANLLSSEARRQMSSASDSLYQQTSGQIVVATVDFTGSATISDYAREMFNQWQIGDAQKKNGVLLLVVPGAEDYYALQGRGTERFLSSADIKRILDEYMEPSFAAEKYEQGILDTFGAFVHVFEREYGVRVQSSSAYNAYTGWTGNERQENDDEGGFPVWIIIAIVVFAFTFSGGSRRRRGWGRRGWGGRGGGTMRTIIASSIFYGLGRKHGSGGFGGFGGFGGGGRSSGGAGRGSGGGGRASGGGGSSRGGGAGRH